MTSIPNREIVNITHGDRFTALQINEYLKTGMHHGTDDGQRAISKIIAWNRVEQVTIALGLRAEEYPRLSSLIWYHTDGQDHGWCAETWKDHAEDLEKERNKLLEQRENALEALGMHPDSDSVDIAEEIRRLRDESRSHFHDAANLAEKVREMERERELDEAELDRLNLEVARLAEEEKGIQ